MDRPNKSGYLLRWQSFCLGTMPCLTWPYSMSAIEQDRLASVCENIAGKEPVTDPKKPVELLSETTGASTQRLPSRLMVTGRVVELFTTV